MKKGRQRQIYINLELEKKAKEHCYEHDITMSSLIRTALEQYLGIEQEGMDSGSKKNVFAQNS